jgi:hypothetical protein
MTTTRYTKFPEYNRFEKENSQEDGFEVVRHKLYKDDVLLTEMVYYFNFVDYIPTKWPAKVMIIDYTDSLEVGIIDNT